MGAGDAPITDPPGSDALRATARRHRVDVRQDELEPILRKADGARAAVAPIADSLADATGPAVKFRPTGGPGA